MKKFVYYLFLLTSLLTGSIVSGQDMSKGFALLEKGNFKEASVFFEQILKEFPENQTAQICYGRAVGLSGDAPKGLQVFEKLYAQHPENPEVLLNLGEAHLWNKDAEGAIKIYSKIFEKDSTHFLAALSIANSYSSIKEYDSAWVYIQKAEKLQPTNESAQISKKFIILGLANEFASEKNEYDRALELIGMNLERDSLDQHSLSLKATVFLIAGRFQESYDTYSKIKDEIASLKGQSVAFHLLGEDEKALSKSEEALRLALERNEEPTLTQTQTHYISALLWNNEVEKGRQVADSLASIKPNDPELIASQAEVAIYEADFIKGASKYSDYLRHVPKSFKGNLGKADAMHALGVDTEAYQLAFRTFDYFPGQKDVNNFIQKLNAIHSPKVDGVYVYGRSSDDSFHHGFKLGSSLSLSPLFSSAFLYEWTQYTSAIGTSTINESARLTNARQINKVLKVSASLGLIKITGGEPANTNYRSDFDVLADIWVSKSQKLTVGYQNEVQSFNQALLQQNLNTQHIVLKNSFFWKLKNLGWYSEAYRSFFSDGNARNLVFTSLYKNLTPKPAIKSGLNYLIMTFQESKPTLYFSPSLYQQLEAFSEINIKDGDFSGIPMDFSWLVAGGWQFSDGRPQLTWRSQMSVAKQLGDFSLKLVGAYSSIVASQVAGFSHLSVEARLSWRLSARPIFYQKIAG